MVCTNIANTLLERVLICKHIILYAFISHFICSLPLNLFPRHFYGSLLRVYFGNLHFCWIISNNRQSYYICLVSCAFAKLRKGNTSFVSSLYPSFLMQQLCSDRTDFHEMLYLSIFRKSVAKIQVSLKSDKNNGYFTWRLCKFIIISRWILLRAEMFKTKVAEKIKTHSLFSVTFSRKSCRLWDNVERYGTAGQATYDNIIRRMRFACWITKATDTRWEYAILIAFLWQKWLRERASMLRNTYIVLFTVALSIRIRFSAAR
jgi:hypothetical protein